MTKKICSVISIALIFSVCLVPFASAVMDASEYFLSYGSGIQSGGGGKAVISIRAVGKAGVNEIGAKSIVVEESSDGIVWTEVKTFTSSAYPEMMAYGANTIYSSVTYNGKSNYYYRATLTFYAGTDGTGDTRTYSTVAYRVS